jgi:hypothetical protein
MRKVRIIPLQCVQNGPTARLETNVETSEAVPTPNLNHRSEMPKVSERHRDLAIKIPHANGWQPQTRRAGKLIRNRAGFFLDGCARL